MWKRLVVACAALVVLAAVVGGQQNVSSPAPVQANHSGVTGSAVPARAAYIGANDSSGNLQGANFCDSTAVYDASTSGSTQLVALVSGKTIYVCGFNFFSAGTANVKLTYGTGTACATGSTNLTPAYQFTAQTGIVQPAMPFGYLTKSAASNALCINSSAAVAVQAMVFYVQR